jgi:hypothetical protein
MTVHKFNNHSTMQPIDGRQQGGSLGSEGLTNRTALVRLVGGFAGPRPTRFDRFERDRDGYDGSGY